jgi:hypothetical protein
VKKKKRTKRFQEFAQVGNYSAPMYIVVDRVAANQEAEAGPQSPTLERENNTKLAIPEVGFDSDPQSIRGV